MWPSMAVLVCSTDDSYAGAPAGYRLAVKVDGGGRVDVHLGPPDRRWFVARRRMIRLQGAIGPWLDGRGPNPGVRMVPRKRQKAWYTTFSTPIGGLTIEEAARLDIAEVTGVLDHVACVTAALFSADLVRNVEVRGVFMQGGLDSTWVKVPEFLMGSGSVGIGRAPGVIEAELKAATLALAGKQLPTGLPLRIRWGIQALAAKDPTDAFSMWMWSLEQLAGDVYESIRADPRLAGALRADADRFLQSAGSDPAPPGMKRRRDAAAVVMMAFTAAHLSPASGLVDVPIFRALRKVRDGLAHGATTAAPTGSQVRQMRELSLQYGILVSTAP